MGVCTTKLDITLSNGKGIQLTLEEAKELLIELDKVINNNKSNVNPTPNDLQVIPDYYYTPAYVDPYNSSDPYTPWIRYSPWLRIT
jgi:hypothetical protein